MEAQKVDKTGFGALTSFQNLVLAALGLLNPSNETQNQHDIIKERLISLIKTSFCAFTGSENLVLAPLALAWASQSLQQNQKQQHDVSKRETKRQNSFWALTGSKV